MKSAFTVHETAAKMSTRDISERLREIANARTAPVVIRYADRVLLVEAAKRLMETANG